MARELFKEDKDIAVVIDVLVKGQSITDVDYKAVVKRVEELTGYRVRFRGLSDEEPPPDSPMMKAAKCERCDANDAGREETTE